MSKQHQDARLEALKLAVSRNAKLSALPDSVVEEAAIYADFILTGVVRNAQHAAETKPKETA